MKPRFLNLMILWCIITALIIFLMRCTFTSQDKLEIAVKKINNETNESDSISKLKYILIWPTFTTDSLLHFTTGLEIFKRRQCPYTNCYVTNQRNFFNDVIQFDVIIFSIPYIEDLPKRRSPHQKYIFASSETPVTYPVCDTTFNKFFNWTWTYKLSSDIIYRYVTIKNKNGSIIGPKEVMHWKKVEEMIPIDENLKKRLSTKKYAAAFFASYCYTSGGREKVITLIKKELKKYGLTLDIYGDCGLQPCPNSKVRNCLKMLETDYYFYLSFETSLSQDYVTEQLLYPLRHYTVPVVFGDADYSRFMPEGIYLDANIHTVPQLVKHMVEIMNDSERYYSYFKWHNYYSYHHAGESPELDSYCKLCEKINSENDFNNTSVCNDFVSWWNGHSMCTPLHKKKYQFN